MDIDPEPCISTTLVHFKCETCSSIDPKGIADQLFGDNKYLVVLHKGKNENPHWHFQGDLAVSTGEYCKTLKKMAEGHSKKIAKPGSRPVKRAMNNVNYTGYQYMLKEDPPHIVVMNQFDDAEIEDLHKASLERQEELKSDLMRLFVQEFCQADENCFYEASEEDENVFDMDPSKDLHNRARVLAFKHYADLKKLPPPNFQRLVLFQLYRALKQEVEDREDKFPGWAKFELYVAQHI